MRNVSNMTWICAVGCGRDILTVSKANLASSKMGMVKAVACPTLFKLTRLKYGSLGDVDSSVDAVSQQPDLLFLVRVDLVVHICS